MPTPAETLIKTLHRLPERAWLRRRTWARLLTRRMHRVDQVRINGGSVAQLPGGVQELRLPVDPDRYPDMARAQVRVNATTARQLWTLPPWFHRLNSESRLAVYAAVPRYAPWTLELALNELPVLVARMQLVLIDDQPEIIWADASPPYWEPAPLEDPTANHPGLPPPEDDDPPSYPSPIYTVVVASVLAPFAAQPARVQLLR
jgi:hypothetical protein